MLLVVFEPREMKFDCWPEAVPPTFERSIVMPGARSRITHGSRADGMFCSMSWEKVDSVPRCRVLMSGLSLVTVTVSWIAEISSCALICALKPVAT